MVQSNIQKKSETNRSNIKHVQLMYENGSASSESIKKTVLNDHSYMYQIYILNAKNKKKQTKFIVYVSFLRFVLVIVVHLFCAYLDFFQLQHSSLFSQQP